MRLSRSASFWIYLLVCYVLLRTCFVAASWREGKAISYDPAGYYLALPAHFIYDDLATVSFYDSLALEYGIGDAVSHTTDLPNGNRVMKYSLGMAVLSSPGFLVGHLSALSNDTFAADGYSHPYYFWLSMWSLLWAFMGLWALRQVLLAYFDEWPVALTLLVLVLATNYIVYAGINNMMSHSFLFTLYAFLLNLTWRWHRSPNWYAAAGIGVVIGLLALSRPTDIVAALIPILWGVHSSSVIKLQAAKFRAHLPQLLLAVLVVLAIGSVQLLYWKSITGQWLYYSYDNQGFNFLRPRIYRGLFSFQKGWLIYTPAMIFAVVGLWQLYQKKRSVFWSIFLFSVINVYIIFSWKTWMYGGSVGCRAIIQSYAVWAFPLTAFIQYVVWKGKHYWKVVFGILLLFFIDLNFLMVWNAHATNGRWHAAYMSQKYYFKIMGRAHVPKDTKKFLDVKTELPNRPIKALDTLIYKSFDEPADSVIVGRSYERMKDGAGIIINQDNPLYEVSTKLPAVDGYRKVWLRANVRSFFINMEWHEWRQARLKMKFYRDGQEIGKQSIRIHWLHDNWTWHHAYFEFPLKKAFGEPSASDEVRLILDHEDGSHDVFFDDLTLEWIELE